MSATLLPFAIANDTAAATSKKLEKQRLLGEYFRTIESDDDLRRAVRYAGGRVFASTEERVLGVSGAIVSAAVFPMLGVSESEYRERTRAAGEIGEALSLLWRSRPAEVDRDGAANDPNPPAADQYLHEPLTLIELSEIFDDLAATGVQERKRDLVRQLFERCETPREAAYAAKIIFGDLRTGVQEGVLQAAVAAAFGRPLKEIQRAQLLVGDLDEVAVLARHDQLASAAFRLFHPIQFMLATPQETAADAIATMDGKPFFAEDKLDGIRAQVHKQGDRIAIYTRTMDRTDESFPDVVRAIATIPGDVLLDGEIVPYRDGRVLPFASIQKRLGRKVLTQKMLAEHPATFIAFDLLYRDGELLLDRPLRERREKLAAMGLLPAHGTGPAGDPSIFAAATESAPSGSGNSAVADHSGHANDADPVATNSTPPGLMSRNPSITVAASPLLEGRSGDTVTPTRERPAGVLKTREIEVTTAEQIETAFARARDSRNEGLVLKDPDSTYSPGRRGKAWLKIKTHLPTLDCVVTAAEFGHGKRRNSLSDYTFAVWTRDPADPAAELVNVGKAFSGVTDEEIATFTELFPKIALNRRGRVFLVPPQVVLEIAFDQIQKSARHASGYAMRFPRIKRIRWDKKPADADQLSRVRELYESAHNFGRVDEVAANREPTLFDGL